MHSSTSTARPGPVKQAARAVKSLTAWRSAVQATPAARSPFGSPAPNSSAPGTQDHSWCLAGHPPDMGCGGFWVSKPDHEKIGRDARVAGGQGRRAALPPPAAGADTNVDRMQKPDRKRAKAGEKGLAICLARKDTQDMRAKTWANPCQGAAPHCAHRKGIKYSALYTLSPAWLMPGLLLRWHITLPNISAVAPAARLYDIRGA